MQTEKEKLYRFTDDLRARFFLPTGKPVDTVALLSRYSRIEVKHLKFKTPGLCGLAMAGSISDTIVLNSNRGYTERNFDCAHELIHLYKHRDAQDSFRCFSYTRPCQNSFMEWQANEGAAQFLVPYQDFIPRFLSCVSAYNPCSAFDIREMLADFYRVTPRVISIRLDSLSYEIEQYRRGVSLERVRLLSRAQRQSYGIKTLCYNAVCDYGLDLDAAVG